MANINLLSNPDDESVNSVYRPLVYEIEITDTSGSTLELVRASCKLYIDGSVVNNNNPIMQDPDLTQAGTTADYTKFTFDISGVAKNHLTSDLQTLGGKANLTAANSLKTLHIFVSGIYKHTTTNVLSVANTQDFESQNEIYIINGVWQHQETQNFVAYEVGAAAKLFLTNQPFGGITDALRYQKIKTTEDMFLSVLNRASGTAKVLEVVTYNSAGGTIDTYQIDVQTTNNRFDIGVGVNNLDDLVSGDMAAGNSGTLPLISATVAKYVFRIKDGSDNYSQVVALEIDRSCYDYSTRFHWLNRLGGFDSWTFQGASSRGQNQKKQTYDKNLDFSFSISDRESAVLSVDSKNVFSAWSGLLNEDQRKWLEELYTSPEVYVVEGGNYVPILITDTQTKTIDDNAQLYQMKANYSYAYETVVNA